MEMIPRFYATDNDTLLHSNWFMRFSLQIKPIKAGTELEA